MLESTNTKSIKATKYKWLIALAWIMAIGALFLFQDSVFAAGGDSSNLGGIADSVKGQMQQVAKLIIVIAYVAGIGFVLAGTIQFKAHKDNPTQVPLSKPIVYLVVGSLLIFLPTFAKSAGSSVFGGSQESGGSGDTEL